MTNKKMPAVAQVQAADQNQQLNYNPQLRLLSLLIEGKKSRQELARRMGMSDRDVRDLISRMRKDGFPICSSSSGGGYWIGSPDEIKRTIAEYRARGYECLKTAIAMEINLEMPGQMEVDNVLV